jgi:hypothetical protein
MGKQGWSVRVAVRQGPFGGLVLLAAALGRAERAPVVAVEEADSVRDSGLTRGGSLGFREVASG